MKTILLTIAFSVLTLAQDTMKVIELKHADPDQVKALFSAFPVAISPVSHLKAIAVRGSKETVETVELALKKVDVPAPPKKNVEFTGYLIFASGKTSDSPEPTELSAVIKQLRGLFPYKTYRVAETFFIRSRDGQGGDTNGVVAYDQAQAPSYSFGFRSASLSSDRMIRMDRLALWIRRGKEGNFGFQTDLDIREGQKVVVGKSNVTGTDEALILVLNAKIIE